MFVTGVCVLYVVWPLWDVKGGTKYHDAGGVGMVELMGDGGYLHWFGVQTRREKVLQVIGSARNMVLERRVT